MTDDFGTGYQLLKYTFDCLGIGAVDNERLSVHRLRIRTMSCLAPSMRDSNLLE